MRYGITFPARPIIKRMYYGVAAPTGLAVSIGSDQTATLTWTDNSTYNTTYLLERKIGSGAYVTVDDAIPGSDSSYHDDTVLLINQSYTYRLTAYYTQQGQFSTSVTVVVDVPPEAPQNLQAFPKSDVTGNISVQLVWDKYSRYETGTLIERSPDGSSWSTLVTTERGVTQYEDTGLTVNTTYYYRVSSVGTLANSATTSASVLTKMNTTAGLLLAFMHKTRTFPRE